jgi:hypothetical protein
MDLKMTVGATFAFVVAISRTGGGFTWYTLSPLPGVARLPGRIASFGALPVTLGQMDTERRACMINLLIEAIKAGFQCDPEKSFARATILVQEIPEQPIPYSDPIPARTLWKFNIDVKILPYPNPLKYGGYWQSFVIDEKPEMRQGIEKIETEFTLYRKIGMTNISITDERQQIIPKQLKLV